MVEFSEILDGLGKKEEPSFRDADRGYRLFDSVYEIRPRAEPEPPRHAPKPHAEPPRSSFDRLVDAYHQFMKPDAARAENAKTPPPPNYGAILSDLKRKKRNVEELRALRRAVAWQCHPDRTPAEQRHRAIAFMAEFNAELDAAMARRRKAEEARHAAG
jgi:hypothetical protein